MRLRIFYWFVNNNAVYKFSVSTSPISQPYLNLINILLRIIMDIFYCHDDHQSSLWSLSSCLLPR
jgi:hypothetical protein